MDEQIQVTESAEDSKQTYIYIDQYGVVNTTIQKYFIKD